MHDFRGPLDPDDPEENSDSDDDDIHAVFMLGFHFNGAEDDVEEEQEEDEGDDDAESNDHPVQVIPNEELSSDSDDEEDAALDDESADEASEVEEGPDQQLVDSPTSPTPSNQGGLNSDTDVVVVAAHAVPYTDPSDSDDLSSLDSPSSSEPETETQPAVKSKTPVQEKEPPALLEATCWLSPDLSSASLSAQLEGEEAAEDGRRSGGSSASSSSSEHFDGPLAPLSGKRKLESSAGEAEEGAKRLASSSVSDNKLDYSNPMESDLEGESFDEESFRGDRIGSSTYAERHVLRILMRWIQELEKQREGDLAEAREGWKLERDLDKELSLLWDMSSEPEVMSYLVEKDILRLLQSTLLCSPSTRMLEIALGILANLLSCSAILNTLPRVDAELGLVEHVLSLVMSTDQVPILIQCVAVIRRVGWYLRNQVEPTHHWLTACTSEAFLGVVSFLLRSSTNVLLLADLSVTMFSLLETLSARDLGQSEEAYAVFCQGGFVASLCEGLGELLKCPTDDCMEELIQEVRVLPGHVQTAVCYGLGALCHLQKLPIGRSALQREKLVVMEFLLEFLAKFELVTQRLDTAEACDYLVSALGLLGFCHAQFSTLQPRALLAPLKAACDLKDKYKQESGQSAEPGSSAGRSGRPSDDYVLTSICVVVHENLAQLRDAFGPSVDLLLSQKTDRRLSAFLSFVTDMATNYGTQRETPTTEAVDQTNLVRLEPS